MSNMQDRMNALSYIQAGVKASLEQQKQMVASLSPDQETEYLNGVLDRMAAMQVEDAETKKSIIPLGYKAREVLLDRRRQAGEMMPGSLDAQAIAKIRDDIREQIQAMNALFRFADIPEIE